MSLLSRLFSRKATSDHVRMERLSRLYGTLSQVNSAILKCAEEQELYERMCTVLVEKGQFTAATISVVDWSRRTSRLVASVGGWQQITRQALADAAIDDVERRTLTSMTLLSGLPVTSNDIQNEKQIPWGYRDVIRQLGVRAVSTVVFRRFDETVAALVLSSSEKDFFSDDILELIAEVGLNVSFALEHFSYEQQRKQAEAMLARSEENLKVTLRSIGDAVLVTDTESRVTMMNPVAELLTGWSEAEARGRPVGEVFNIVNEESRKVVESPIDAVLRDGVVVGLANHTVLIARDGTERPIADSGAPIRYSVDDEIRGVVLVFRDQSEEHRINKALHDSEQLYAALTKNVPVGVYLADTSGELIYANRQFLKIVGMDRDEFSTELIRHETMHPDDRERMARVWYAACKTSEKSDFGVYRYLHGDGKVVWAKGMASPILDEHNNVTLLAGVVTDITETRMLEERDRLAAQVFQNSGEGIMIADTSRNIVMTNQALINDSGYREDEILGSSTRMFRSGPDDEVIYKEIGRALDSGRNWRGEINFRRKSGEIFPALLSVSVARDEQGTITHFVMQETDISAQKKVEQHITYLAYRDSLTGLPNRTLLRDRVEQGIFSAHRESSHVALLFLDLDHFKNINDSLGHAAGDQLLKDIAQRLTLALREIDTVGRLGGDEFLIVLPGVDADAAAHVAQKLLTECLQPFLVQSRSLKITLSIGIAIYPKDGKGFDELLKAADTAMYQAKDAGRNAYRFYTPEMNEVVFQRMVLESSLLRAIENNELLLHYQPKFNLSDQTFVGMEALIRWNQPEMGMISPGQFIPVAEESGLIEAIGKWVLEESCRQMKRWIDQGLSPMRIAVNFSARQFQVRNIVELVTDTLHKFDLGGEILELEITESLLAKDMEYTLKTLHTLKGIGVSMAVDDFGTGYSSLTYLKRFPIDRLKIDQSFVRDLVSDADDRAIATAIVTLGHSLGMRVIAEGVETSQQMDILRDMGCDEIQGYYLGHPVSAEEMTAFLAQN